MIKPGKLLHYLELLCIFILPVHVSSQVRWTNADADYGPLPASFHVYRTTDSLEGKPFIAYYAKALLHDKTLDFTTDTTRDRRITPISFYNRNKHPLLVVNTAFFSYESNRSLNVIIKERNLLAYNTHTLPMRGKDTFQYRHPLGSAIGIDRNRNADVAWLLTDSTKRFAYASQVPTTSPLKDSIAKPSFRYLKEHLSYLDVSVNNVKGKALQFKKWKMQTAVGGGPVLVQNGKVRITNEEELKFAGKAFRDKHPRTCMGYTRDGYLVIMVIEGRYPGIAEGATLEQEAKLLIEIGCIEALNLDGGGSSCMLINGKETIKPSEKGEERPVPSVFLIRSKNN